LPQEQKHQEEEKHKEEKEEKHKKEVEEKHKEEVWKHEKEEEEHKKDLPYQVETRERERRGEGGLPEDRGGWAGLIELLFLSSSLFFIKHIYICYFLFLYLKYLPRIEKKYALIKAKLFIIKVIREWNQISVSKILY
jgi:hypothetical protein